jgi:GTP cyclohydrolase II
MRKNKKKNMRKTDEGITMNKPSVSLDVLARLAEIEQDKAMERVMRKHGFTGADFYYMEEGGKRQLLIGKKAFDYIKAHKDTMKSEIQEAIDAGIINALNAGVAMINLQKTAKEWQ